MLGVWLKMCLRFLSVWFRVDSGLGKWFIADWLKVGDGWCKVFSKGVRAVSFVRV